MKKEKIELLRKAADLLTSSLICDELASENEADLKKELRACGPQWRINMFQKSVTRAKLRSAGFMAGHTQLMEQLKQMPPDATENSVHEIFSNIFKNQQLTK